MDTNDTPDDAWVIDVLEDAWLEMKPYLKPWQMDVLAHKMLRSLNESTLIVVNSSESGFAEAAARGHGILSNPPSESVS